MSANDNACGCDFKVAATARGCVQIGVDHWQDWQTTQVFSGAATFAMLDAWAKKTMGPQATWNDLLLSTVAEDAAHASRKGGEK